MDETQQRLQRALILRVRRVCEHVTRGKAANKESAIWQQKTLAISSIILSTVSGTGIAAFKGGGATFWI